MDDINNNTQDLKKYYFVLCLAYPAFFIGLIMLILGISNFVDSQTMSVNHLHTTTADFMEVARARAVKFDLAGMLITGGLFITIFVALPLFGAYYRKLNNVNKVKVPFNSHDVKVENTSLKQQSKEEPKMEKDEVISCPFCGKKLSSLEARCGYCEVIINE